MVQSIKGFSGQPDELTVSQINEIMSENVGSSILLCLI